MALKEQDTKSTLFEIDAAIDAIAEAFDEAEANGASTEGLDQLESYFAGLLIDRDKKLDAYARLIRKREYLAKTRKAEADRINALAKTDENTVKALKARLKFFFESNEITKLETEMNKFSIQGNGGAQAMKITGEVPDDYTVTITAPDTEAIREALEAGKELDFAHLEPRGTSLRIK